MASRIPDTVLLYPSIANPLHLNLFELEARKGARTSSVFLLSLAKRYNLLSIREARNGGP